VEILVLQLKLTGFDFRKIEDVINESSEVLALSPEYVSVPFLLLIQPSFGEQIRHTQQRVERGADLVANIREKGDFSLSCPLSRLLSFPRLVTGDIKLDQ